MATTMTFSRSAYGNAPIATCPDCGTVCAYWDADDLNEDGTLTCWCDPSPSDNNDPN